MLRSTLIAILACTLAACAGKFTLIDRQDGQLYHGSTDGSTAGGNGTATITIEGLPYRGPWVYQAKSGAFGFTSFGATTSLSGAATTYGSSAGALRTDFSGTAVTSGRSTTMLQSAVGNGMVNARAADGRFIRCVFTFNTLNNTGIGQCLRSDGRVYDLQVKR